MHAANPTPSLILSSQNPTFLLPDFKFKVSANGHNLRWPLMISLSFLSPPLQFPQTSRKPIAAAAAATAMH
ncbi:hypothetical protein L6452_09701 [Arctium lappa]|uniref:Uncharacterized protein n=1 Tax=Arctium lappa TaxID=4217 RepID=A0ACB9DKQ1_ARCLA|nr:hypothetical protein L6452_09701 [Arctium lappa]